MIAIILAGGYARRLLPLTKDRPKPLLEVGGRAIVGHIMERLIELTEEVERVIILTNRRFEARFRDWLSSSGYPRASIVADDSRSEGEKPGAVAALAKATSRIEGEDCIIVAGDNLFTSSLEGMVRAFEKKGSAMVALYRLMDPKRVKGYSCAEVDAEGRVVEFVEKPERPRSGLVGTGIYIFPSRAVAQLQLYVEQGVSRDEPGRFVEWLYRREPVYGYLLDGLWWDVGTVRDYMEARRALEGASARS